MKNRFFRPENRPWMYVSALMVLQIAVTVFIACQSDDANTGLNGSNMSKITKTTCFVEGGLDDMITIPPPPPQAIGKKANNSSASDNLGINICIAENTSFGISHAYRKDTGTEKGGLIILYVYDKGDMKVTWADPEYTGDDRLDHINKAIQNNCVVVISLREVNFKDAKENRSAELFWKQFNMTPTPPLPNDPGQEYFVKQVTGVKGCINLINGTLKVL